MKKYCIIVAGGSGRRMKSAIPKQFLLLDGKPLLMHTVERFHSFDSSIELILVLPPEHHSLWDSLITEYSLRISHTVAAGGEERFHSVRAGLAVIRARMALAGEGKLLDRRGESPAGGDTPGEEHSKAMTADAGQADAGGESLVAIHDGVRPLVSHDTIWRCYADAEEFGSAVPFVEPADSVRVLHGDDSTPMPRNEVRLIQTPQVFHGTLIMNAYDRDFDPAFTDDATVAEAFGVKIHLTHGNRENIKITTPEDLAVAHTLAGMLRQ
jgi:2-C-methyl-D-erythritol 4-phosphate cytidylyltransferase